MKTGLMAGVLVSLTAMVWAAPPQTAPSTHPTSPAPATRPAPAVQPSRPAAPTPAHPATPAPTPAPAAPKEPLTDEQFMALGTAKLKAELACRKARQFFDDNDGRWRNASAGPDAARTTISEALAKALVEEQRRPEELRNASVIDELTQRRSNIEADYQRFYSVERPGLEAGYRAAAAQAAAVWQLFQSVNQLDNSWKDAKVDLDTLMAVYAAVATRADQVRAQAEKCVTDLEAIKKTWDSAAKATTQPATVQSQ